MRQFTLVLLVLTISAVNIFAQSKTEITGFVISEEEPLVSATVVLLSEKDSTLVNFGLTNNKGFFKIPSINNGDYLLQITFLGFEQFSQPIIADGTKIELGEILLSTASSTLDAVEIKAEHVPMMMKRDTLEYNAAAFQTQPNELVEDLLKRLPGVEVESDGTIKAQGEEVTQVLVDGKKFFGDDPKIATRNLPASAIEKVQVFDKKSDAAEFSGVDDGEEQKTINLDLKKGAKAGAFGNLVAGYGTDERYKGSLSLSKFSQKTQVSLIGNINNVNEQGFSTGDYMNFMSGVGWGNGRGAVSLFNGLSNGFVTTNAGGLNVNHDFSKKSELSISYFVNDIKNEIESTTIRENYGNETNNFFTNESSNQTNTNTNHKITLELDQEIDSTQSIRIRGGITFNNGVTISNNQTSISNSQNVLENESVTDLSADGKNTRLNLNGTYRKKFGKTEKKILTLTGFYNEALVESLTELISDNTIFEDNGAIIQNLLIQDQLNEDNQSDYRIRLSFVEPIGLTKYLEFRYERRNYNNNVVADFFDIVNNEREFNIDLSNAFLREYYYNNVAAIFHFNTDKSQLSMEASVQNSKLTGDITYEDLIISTDIIRFLPRFSWRYDIGNGKNFRINYSTNINEPSITQLQPNANNSNPLNIYIGNPELIPEYRHSLGLNYFSYDQFSFSSFFAYMNINYTKNSITNITSFDENFVQTTTPVNVSYAFNSSASQAYGTPLKFINLRINLRNRISYNKSFIFINDRQSDLERINGNVRLTLENRNKQVWDWTIGGSYGYNINRYSDDSSNDLSYSSQNAFADITYSIKKSFALSAGLDVNFYSQEQFGEQQSIPILKASISKFILKDQKGEIKLSGFDLFNRNLGISRTENQNYIENTEIISLSRYFMLSFTYGLRPGGGKAKEMHR